MDTTLDRRSRLFQELIRGPYFSGLRAFAERRPMISTRAIINGFHAPPFFRTRESLALGIISLLSPFLE